MPCRLSLVSRLFCFTLHCFVFRLHAFVEAAALCSIVLRYAGAPIGTRFFFFEVSLFPSIVLYHFCFIFVRRVRRTFFPPEWCFSTLWPPARFFTSAYVRIQSINQSTPHLLNVRVHSHVSFFRRKLWASKVMYRGSAADFLVGLCKPGNPTTIATEGNYMHLDNFLRLIRQLSSA